MMDVPIIAWVCPNCKSDDNLIIKPEAWTQKHEGIDSIWIVKRQCACCDFVMVIEATQYADNVRMLRYDFEWGG